MFAGWLPLTGRGTHPDPAKILATIDPFGTADRTGNATLDGATLVQAQLLTSPPDERGSIPAVCAATGNTAVGWIRLANRTQLLGDLGVASREAELSDLDLALAAYRRWGERAASHLRGEFALCIWDVKRREAYLARDPLGTRPLFVSWTKDAAACATTLAALSGLPGIIDEPDPVWMACYIADLPSGPVGPLAIRGAQRLPAGHWGYLGTSGLRTSPYHELRDDPPWEDQRDPLWLDAYREQLSRAVAFGASTPGLLGVEASGGLDSSTLIALAAQSRPDGGRTVHGLGYAVFDREPSLILATSAMWRVSTNYIFTRWDNGAAGELAARQRIFDTAVGHPCQHGSVLGFFEVLSTAQRNGIRVLVSGYGGDEGVTTHGFEALDELAGRGQWAAIASNYPSRKALRLVRLGQWAWRQGREPSDPAGAAGFEAHGGLVRSIFAPHVAEEVLALSADTAGPEDTVTSVNGRVLRMLGSPWRDIRLEQSAAFARAFGIEYRWPLLDAELVQQFLDTPTVWKMARGQGRFLHKSAMAGLLPDEVLRYTSKHMGARIPYISDQGTLTTQWTGQETEETVPVPDTVGGLLRPDTSTEANALPPRASSRVQRLAKWLLFNR